MKVLVGIDGSERSYEALRFVSSLLAAQADTLLLYFSPPTFHLEASTELPDAVVREAADALASVVLARAKSHLSPEFRPETRTISEPGNPAEGLLAVADAEHVDLIVVGAHGAQRTLSFFLGGTARQVAHLATKPVLVVRGGGQIKRDAMKLLVACDQERWQAAAPILDHLSWPPRTTATLFHVVESLDDQHIRYLQEDEASPIPHSQQLVRACELRVERDKETRAEQLRTPHGHGPRVLRGAEVEVVQGHPAERIIQQVESDETDLVVVGARRLGPIGRLLGSTTEALLIRCPCSLLIVHEKAAGEK